MAIYGQSKRVETRIFGEFAKMRVSTGRRWPKTCSSKSIINEANENVSSRVSPFQIVEGLASEEGEEEEEEFT